ncbi:MAG: sigma 54-interacting transcriptional regulator [Candidatus Eisenbacteria bacterium]
MSDPSRPGDPGERHPRPDRLDSNEAANAERPQSGALRPQPSPQPAPSPARDLARDAAASKPSPFERLLDPAARTRGVSESERRELVPPRLFPSGGRDPWLDPRSDRQLAALRDLLQVMRRLSSILDHESLLDAILDAVIPLTGAQRALVLLQQGTQLDVARGRDVSRESIPADAGQISLTLARRCMAQNELLEFDELSTRPDLREIKSIQLNQLFSAVCVPLRKQNQPFGVLYLDSSLPTMTPTPGDREMLEAFAAQASVCLVNADLIRELENSKVVLTRENQELIAKVQGGWKFATLIGRSEEMQKLFERLRLVKDLDLAVVLIGESGTGKELVAQALHSEGTRAKQSFVPVNCGAIPANLFESEFFGHVRGAFTGANVDRPGLVEQADHGTLFLDEIGDMPIEFQPKLLRFLESGEFRRVGETRVRKANVRVISATHRDLRKMADEGTFRADLFYRLDGVHVDLPPLRERRRRHRSSSSTSSSSRWNGLVGTSTG